jgi:N,N-dimethylformamidase beta subunit-like, C-terminal
MKMRFRAKIVFLILILFAIAVSVFLGVQQHRSRFIDIVENEVVFSRHYSVIKGEALDVYYNLPSETEATLYRLGKTKEKISSHKISGVYQNAVRYEFETGLDIESTYSLNTDQLTSGYYLLQGKSPSGRDFAVPFVVADPVCTGLAVVASTNTWAAYNNYVMSNYEDLRPLYFRIEDMIRKLWYRLLRIRTQYRYLPVSLPWKRPSIWAISTSKYDLATEPTGDHLLMLEWQLITALEKEQVPYCVLDDRLFAYDRFYEDHGSFIFNGHSEYWSKGMIRQLDRLIEQEKKILFSGGNNIYREVEFNEAALTVIGQQIDEEITASRIGAYYDTRGYSSYAPMKVLDFDHWVFKDVTSTVIGKKSIYAKAALTGGISGHETDKISHYSTKFSVLARGMNQDSTGGADFVFRDNNQGWILNFASLSFMGGYFVDPNVKIVVQNILTDMQK